MGDWSTTGVPHSASWNAKPVIASMARRPFLISAASISFRLYMIQRMRYSGSTWDDASTTGGVCQPKKP
eukprot:scaffold250_cov110-Isochrysis_galbana.AAC.18